MKRKLYVCFIDYTKAFDKVRHENLLDLLQQLDMDGKDVRVIRNLYWEQSAAVRIDEELSKCIEIHRGVRQGCVFSPDLFNLYSENIMREISNIKGIVVGGYNMNNVRYADDTTLIAESEEKLQDLLEKVRTESERKGLSINVKKTECMVISKEKVPPKCVVKVDEEVIKQVDKFNYLGSMITIDGRCDTEIKKRIGIAKDSFQKMGRILKDRKMNIRIKVRLLKCYVHSVFLYECECWTISPTMQKKIEAAEMWFYRRMLRISWTEHVTNEEVLTRAGTKRELMMTIRQRQLRFLGHVMRKDELENVVLTGKIEGTRNRGRKRLTYISSLSKCLDLSNTELLKATKDRELWKTMIANVRIG